MSSSATVADAAGLLAGGADPGMAGLDAAGYNWALFPEEPLKTNAVKLGLALALAAAGPMIVRAQTPSAETTCQLDPAAAPDKPFYIDAVVLGPASDEEVLTQTRVAIMRTHAPESPSYVKLPRIDAIFKIGGVAHRTIAAVVSGRTPARGARVKLASRHRDPNEPCAFIPWTVVDPGSEV